MAALPSVVKIMVLLLFVANGSRAADWKYHKDGSNSSWGDHSPICDGNSQSPINIIHESTVYDRSLTQLAFKGYSGTQNGTMVNTGHSLQYNPDGRVNSTISGGPVEGSTYTLAQFHFHFGSHDLSGSEHTLKGVQKPAEVHFVHYNSDRYSSVNKAVNESDGLAVIGVFLEIGEASSQIDQLHIDRLPYKNNKTDVSQLILWDLLPANKDYYTYNGSLTTPPCFESVRWIVMKDAITLSKDQMNNFRNAINAAHGESHDHDDIADNFRDVQPLNGRTVKRNFVGETSGMTPAPASTPTSGGAPLMAPKIIALFSFFLVVLAKVFDD